MRHFWRRYFRLWGYVDEIHYREYMMGVFKVAMPVGVREKQ